MKKMLAFALIFMLLFSTALAETATETAIELESLVMSDGFTFAVPAKWGYENPSEEMLDKGVFLICGDPDANLSMMGVMEGADPQLTTEMLTEAMTAKTESFYSVKQVKNEMGMDVILFVSADYTTMGFSVLDGKGSLISFIFGHTDSTPITDDQALAALVSECAKLVGYTEPAAPAEEPAQETAAPAEEPADVPSEETVEEPSEEPSEEPAA